MNMSDLKQKSSGELRDLLASKRHQLLEFRFRKTSGKISNLGQLREARKDIARILTLLRK